MSSVCLLSSIAVAYASIGIAQEFQHGCGTSGRLPPPLKSVLQAIDQTDPLNIDEACGIKGGAGSDNPGKQAESSAKNNFCATASAVTITTQTLRALQREVDKDESLKTKAKAGDRSGLAKLVKVGSQTIGEGSPVTLVAYLQDAHFSNVKKGELVNCKKPGRNNNDIHVSLVSNPNEDDACNSFTAEISPHFRPEPWEEIVQMQLGTRPVRVTGSLFFDGSHTPCTPTKAASPKRSSVWEIHPVYGFDVCRFRSKSKCRADSAAWIPLHEWVGDIDSGEEH